MTTVSVILLQSACECYLMGNKQMGDKLYTDYQNIQPQPCNKPKETSFPLLTYDEWRNRGYQVQSGEKATWVEGLPLFKRSQVMFKL